MLAACQSSPSPITQSPSLNPPIIVQSPEATFTTIAQPTSSLPTEVILTATEENKQPTNQTTSTLPLLIPSITSTITPDLTPTPTVTVQPAITQGSTQVTVIISDYAFTPKKLTIQVYTTVTWIEIGKEPHTVNADDGSFLSGILNSGESFSYTFTTPGVYYYFCKYHGNPNEQGMSGIITVTQ